MIEEPVVGMKVRVTSKDCCYGHPRDTKGVICSVDAPDSFLVDFDGCTYYHCRNCVEEVPDAHQD